MECLREREKGEEGVGEGEEGGMVRGGRGKWRQVEEK